MTHSRSRRTVVALAASVAIASSLLLSGCGLVPNVLADENAANSPAKSQAAEERWNPAAQQQFFDNVILAVPVVASLDPSSSWASVEPQAWEDADPAVRGTVVGMGLDACTRADDAAGASELEDPAMTWLAARFLCEEHREVADEFLSNDASISPTHTMADLFELAVVKEDATTDELLDANNVCIAALAVAWEVHAGFTPDATCWLIRVQSVEETGGDAEYVSLLSNVDEAKNAAVDARFGELAEASGATPNALSELLDGME
ncbi:hypothetical protein [Leucobacter luti]|uniref:hypothetical protein n=1 Tax=Leucobacter luti TaxID=340320 RepID=UPI001FB34C26|nr:hypothetical protein [Leucobacter luti]MCW2288366.1 hypothetical protein [Leucobacter luti]